MTDECITADIQNRFAILSQNINALVAKLDKINVHIDQLYEAFEIFIVIWLLWKKKNVKKYVILF